MRSWAQRSTALVMGFVRALRQPAGRVIGMVANGAVVLVLREVKARDLVLCQAIQAVKGEVCSQRGQNHGRRAAAVGLHNAGDVVVGVAGHCLAVLRLVSIAHRSQRVHIVVGVAECRETLQLIPC